MIKHTIDRPTRRRRIYKWLLLLLIVMGIVAGREFWFARTSSDPRLVGAWSVTLDSGRSPSAVFEFGSDGNVLTYLRFQQPVSSSWSMDDGVLTITEKRNGSTIMSAVVAALHGRAQRPRDKRVFDVVMMSDNEVLLRIVHPTTGDHVQWHLRRIKDGRSLSATPPPLDPG